MFKLLLSKDHGCLVWFCDLLAFITTNVKLSPFAKFNVSFACEPYQLCNVTVFFISLCLQMSRTRLKNLVRTWLGLLLCWYEKKNHRI